MFENLNKKIRRESLNKLRRLNDGEESQEIAESDREDSLSDLDIELEERQKNFNKIMSIPDNCEDDDLFIRRDDTYNTPPSYMRKLRNQLQLSHQKLRLQQDTYKKELKSIREMHEREKQFFEMEIQKLKLELNREKKIREDTKILRKENQNLLQINEQLLKRIQENENAMRRNQHHRIILQEKIQKIETNNTTNILKVEKQEQEYSQLRKKIANLEQEKQHWKSRFEKKQSIFDKMDLQLKNLQQKLNSEKQMHAQVLVSLKNQSETRISCLERQVESLQKRNKYLEDMFLEKINQITKLQATFFTQNISNTSHTHNRISLEETLNLQEESPIRSTKHDQNQRLSMDRGVRKARIHSTQQNMINPEKNRQNYQKNENSGADLNRQNKKLRQKISYANQKLIQLLGEKIRNQKKILQLTKRIK